MWPNRRQLACLLCSWLAWSVVALHVRDLRSTLNGYNDHLSHLTIARVFLHHGFDIYRKPGSDFCRKPPSARAVKQGSEAGCSLGDLCDMSLDEGPKARAGCIGWQDRPHPYPPGAVLSFVPEALLARFTRLSPRVLAGIVVVKYLFGTHLMLWALYRVVFASPDPLARGSSLRTSWSRGSPWLRWGLFGLLSIETMKWTLTGFYDPLAIFAVLVGIYHLRGKRHASAFLWLSAGLCLHYRALWYLPLLAAAAFGCLRRREWASPARTALKLLVGLALSGTSLYVFFLLRQVVGKFPETNPVQWQHVDMTRGPFFDLAVPCLIVLGYLAAGRHWLLFSTVAWQVFVVLNTPQTMNWHSLFLLPLLGVATLERGHGPMVAALTMLAVETVVIFGAFPLPGGTIVEVWGSWGPWMWKQ